MEREKGKVHLLLALFGFFLLLFFCCRLFALFKYGGLLVVFLSSFLRFTLPYTKTKELSRMEAALLLLRSDPHRHSHGPAAKMGGEALATIH